MFPRLSPDTQLAQPRVQKVCFLRGILPSGSPTASYPPSGKREVPDFPTWAWREPGLPLDLWNFPAPLSQQLNKKGAHGISRTKGAIQERQQVIHHWARSCHWKRGCLHCVLPAWRHEAAGRQAAARALRSGPAPGLWVPAQPPTGPRRKTLEQQQGEGREKLGQTDKLLKNQKPTSSLRWPRQVKRPWLAPLMEPAGRAAAQPRSVLSYNIKLKPT